MSIYDQEFRIAPIGDGKLIQCRTLGSDYPWTTFTWFRDPGKAAQELERINKLKEEADEVH